MVTCIWVFLSMYKLPICRAWYIYVYIYSTYVYITCIRTRRPEISITRSLIILDLCHLSWINGKIQCMNLVVLIKDQIINSPIFFKFQIYLTDMDILIHQTRKWVGKSVLLVCTQLHCPVAQFDWSIHVCVPHQYIYIWSERIYLLQLCF